MDRAGNQSDPQVRTVTAYGALGYVAASRPVFFPQDGDALVDTLSLTYRLRSAATVDWTIRNASGDVVRTILAGSARAAGPQAFTWNGRNDAGALVPRGTYRSVVTATDGTLTATQSVAVVADAFRITTSDATPARGQKLTVTATTRRGPRHHAGAPRLPAGHRQLERGDEADRQPHLAHHRDAQEQRAPDRLRLRVSALDAGGAGQSSNLLLPLH